MKIEETDPETGLLFPRRKMVWERIPLDKYVRVRVQGIECQLVDEDEEDAEDVDIKKRGTRIKNPSVRGSSFFTG